MGSPTTEILGNLQRELDRAAGKEIFEPADEPLDAGPELGFPAVGAMGNHVMRLQLAHDRRRTVGAARQAEVAGQRQFCVTGTARSVDGQACPGLAAPSRAAPILTRLRSAEGPDRQA